MNTESRDNAYDGATGTSIETILMVGSENSRQPPPTERLGQEVTPMPPPPKPYHVRSATFAGRNDNRLSLSLPVLLPGNFSATRPSPTSSQEASALTSPVQSTASPSDSGSFILALASQERRVLELREELNRAEAELLKLKRQFASHEATKKRASIRKEVQLGPVHNRDPSERDSDEEVEDASARRTVELDRRKAMVIGGPKSSRRIFTGSHTRALSLLSPDRGSHFPSTAERQYTPHTARGMSLSSTVPEFKRTHSSNNRYSLQDNATSGVKQIAEDLKSGLWTFMEDLRQATVGEEPLQGPPQTRATGDVDPRTGKTTNKNPTTSEGITRNRTTTAGPQKNRQSAKPLPSPINVSKAERQSLVPPIETPKSPGKAEVSTWDDDWSNWDSPTSKIEASPRWSDSTAPSLEGDGEQAVKGPPKSSSKGIQDDEIPWPALGNLTPSNLKRTASNIMKEWERSLTPSPRERGNPMSGKSNSNQRTTQEQEQESSLLLNNLPL